jgi:hypothetical protein
MLWILLAIVSIIRYELLTESAFISVGHPIRRLKSCRSMKKDVSGFPGGKPEDDMPTNISSPINTPKRRTNKYKNFSKVNEESDPLDALIAESQRKSQEIVIAARTPVQWIGPSPEISTIPKVVFPDVKGIDVSFANYSFEEILDAL